MMRTERQTLKRNDNTIENILLELWCAFHEEDMSSSSSWSSSESRNEHIILTQLQKRWIRSRYRFRWFLRGDGKTFPINFESSQTERKESIVLTHTSHFNSAYKYSKVSSIDTVDINTFIGMKS